jgi:transcriptional regulator with XRE-family HTH domain
LPTKTELLGEKLKDLRSIKKSKLADVDAATGISTSTLQRLESGEDIRVRYQDIETLARHYDVLTDYLFGLTDLQQYRNIEIDKLRLSDAAIDVLQDGKLNNRLISKFLAHPSFSKLLSAMEIYIDRKVLPQMNTMNALYKYAEQTIKENADVPEGDAGVMGIKRAVTSK